MKETLQKHKQYLLTGVSYVIPFIACGGILIALSIAYAFQFLPPNAKGGPDTDHLPPIMANVLLIGGTAFTLFPAVLAGFISYGMAGKPGLVPGFIGGYIAGMQQIVPGTDRKINAGFLGAIIIGLVAGHLVNLLKKLKVPAMIKPVMPIIVIPIVSAVPVGLFMLWLNIPLGRLMLSMGDMLAGMQSGSQILLAMVLGAMIAVDMGARSTRRRSSLERP